VPVPIFVGAKFMHLFSLGVCLVRCVTVTTACAGDPLVAHSLDALKKRTKRSKAGTNGFSLTNGKPAALGNGGMKSTVLKLLFSVTILLHM